MDSTRPRFLGRRLALLLSSCLALAALQACGFHGMHSSRSDGEYEWSHGPRRVVVKTLGQVGFADDDQSVTSLSSDGYLLIEERVLLDSKALEYTPGADGSIRVRQLIGGEEKPFDDDARAWMARILPEVLRRTGIHAPQRAARILANRGVEALLQEVRSLPADFLRTIYLRAAAQAQGLTPDQKLRLVQEIGRSVDSDSAKATLLAELSPEYEETALIGAWLEASETIGSSSNQASLLGKLLERHCDSPGSLALVLASTRTIESDSNKAATLRLAAKCAMQEEPTRAAFFDAVDSIRSDNDRASTLSAMIQEQGEAEGVLVSSLVSAGRLESDSHKAEVLALASRRFSNTDAVREAFFGAAEQIGSDSHRSRALTALLENSQPDALSLARLYQAAGGIDSDSAMAAVLTRSLERYAEDPILSKQLFGAVGRIDSDNDRVAVLLAIAAQAGAGKPTLLQVIESAEALDGDSNKARILIPLSRRAAGDPELTARLGRAAETLGSGSSYRSVVSALNQGGSRPE